MGMVGLVEEQKSMMESFRSAIPYGSFPIEKDIQAMVNFSKSKF